MADEKISQLPTVTNSAIGGSSIFPVVDSNDSTTKSIAISQLDDRWLADPFTTLGDTVFGGTSGVATRLPGNTTANPQILAQTGTGSASAAPDWQSVTAVCKAPTVTVLKTNSGSTHTGTYTTPAGVLYLEIQLTGGGGAGGGAGSSSSSSGGADTSINSTLLVASGGGAGTIGNGGGGGGIPVAPSFTSGPIILAAIQGASGGGGVTSITASVGGMGGASHFGGAGAGQYSVAGSPAQADSGSGGGGGGVSGSGVSGGGGASGSFIWAIINSPATTYTFQVGGKGIAGLGVGNAGANGGDGLIIIKEFYQ